MAGNAVTEGDTTSGDAVLKFSRKKLTERIDGIMAATCMALPVDMVSREVRWYVIGNPAL